MKVLVATRETQGAVPGDYFGCVEGELVTAIAVECCEPDRCGCGRGFPGLASTRATSTAMVVDLPEFTRDDLATALRDSLQRDGWFQCLTYDEEDDLVDDHLRAIELIVGEFPAGTVIGRDGDHVTARPGLRLT